MANVSMARYRNFHFSDALTGDFVGHGVERRWRSGGFGENMFAIMTVEEK